MDVAIALEGKLERQPDRERLETKGILADKEVPCAIACVSLASFPPSRFQGNRMLHLPFPHLNFDALDIQALSYTKEGLRYTL